jgi:hypothetical protein
MGAAAEVGRTGAGRDWWDLVLVLVLLLVQLHQAARIGAVKEDLPVALSSLVAPLVQYRRLLGEVTVALVPVSV